jgi:outer membrane protein assembly factor BamB
VTQQPQARLARIFPALAATLLCAAVTFTGGCRRRDAKPAAASGEGLPLQTFARQWATDLKLKGDALRRLHVREGAVYAYTTDGRAISLARDSGSIEFNRPIKGGGTMLHPPVVMMEKVNFSIPRRRQTAADRGQMPVRRPNQPPEPEAAPPRDEYVIQPVVFPTATTLEIYEQHTGRFITANNLDFTVRSAPVGKAGMMYLGAALRGSSRGVSVDIREPYVPVRWELMTPEGAVSAAPALWEDAVYFASEGGDVYAVTSAARESIWPLPGGVFKTGAAVVADLAVDAECVYVASTDNKLYALNRNNGKIRWQYFGGTALRAAPAVTSDTVYQYVPGTGLVAIDKAAGEPLRKPRWVAKDATQFLAQDERHAYVRSRGNRIVALDKKSGEVRFTSQKREGKNEFAVFGTNVSKEDGIVYAGTKAGRVVAVRPVLKPGTVGEVVLAE